jgi:DNA repair exonuclease SbcCD ATPase subunit
VDARTEQVLRQVVQAQRRVAELEALLTRLEGDRARIHQEQERIRENLKSLGDRSSEKELRERFVRTLNAQEDRLEQIQADLAARAAERDEARARVNDLLANLEFEGA